MVASVLSSYRNPEFESPVAALTIPVGVAPSPRFRDLQRFWILDETGRQCGMLYVRQKVLIQLTGFNLLPSELYCWRTDWMDTREEVIASFREVCKQFGIVVLDGKDAPVVFETPNLCISCDSPLWAFTDDANRMHKGQEVCIACGVRHRREVTDSSAGKSSVYYDLPTATDIINKAVRTQLEWRIGTTEKTMDGVLHEKHVVTNELTRLRALGRVYRNNQIQVIS